MRLSLICFSLILSFASLAQKIGGVNFESPKDRISTDYIASTERISANWIAIVPFAFMDSNDPAIEYNCDKNWWGSTPEGISTTVNLAKKHNQKTMLKPHFWVDNKGWAGELSFNTKGWDLWEANYTTYILEMAALAESLEIEMLCIGGGTKIICTVSTKILETINS